MWHRGPDPTIGLLDERLVDLAGDELTFAEWFARWDAGSRAVIVDRLALPSRFGPEIGMHSQPLDGQGREHFTRDAGTSRAGSGGAAKLGRDHDHERAAGN